MAINSSSSSSSSKKQIDLNADVAEACGQDSELMPIISSANICCGLHAGSATEILTTLRLAKHHNVRVGAHPSYDDRANFGRSNQNLDNLAEDEIRAVIRYQLGAMQALCEQAGVTLSYVKPHGALYNQASANESLAKIVADEIKQFNPNLTVMALSGGKLIDVAKAMGLTTQSEVFADRRYEDNGALVARSQPNAVIADDDEAIAQVLQMIQQGTVTSTSGKTVPVVADSICLHGDNAHAIEFAKKIQAKLTAENIAIGSH